MIQLKTVTSAHDKEVALLTERCRHLDSALTSALSQASFPTTSSNARSSTATDTLKADRRRFKTASANLAGELTRAREEWSAREEKFKEEAREMARRLVGAENRGQACIEDLSEKLTSLQNEFKRAETGIRSERCGFGLQKQAYLSRISELEGDLDIAERDLLVKDRQLHDTYTERLKVETGNEDLRAFADSDAAVLTQLRLELSECNEEIQALRDFNEQDRVSYETVVIGLERQLERASNYAEENKRMAILRGDSRVAEAKQAIVAGVESEKFIQSQRMEADLTSKLEACKLELAESQSNGLLMVETIRTSEVENAGLKESLESSHMKFSNLREVYRCNVQDIAGVRADLEMRVFELSNLQEKCDRSDEERLKIEERLSISGLDVTELHRQIEQLEDMVALSRQDRDIHVSSLHEDLEAAKESLALASRRYEYCVGERENDVCRYETVIEDLEIVVESLRAEANDARLGNEEALGSLRNSLSALEAKCALEKKEHAEIEANLNGEILVLERNSGQSRLEAESLSVKLRQNKEVLAQMKVYNGSEMSGLQSTLVGLESKVLSGKNALLEMESKMKAKLAAANNAFADMETTLNAKLQSASLEMEISSRAKLTAEKNAFIELENNLLESETSLKAKLALGKSALSELETNLTAQLVLEKNMHTEKQQTLRCENLILESKVTDLVVEKDLVLSKLTESRIDVEMLSDYSGSLLTRIFDIESTLSHLCSSSDVESHVMKQEQDLSVSLLENSSSENEDLELFVSKLLDLLKPITLCSACDTSSQLNHYSSSATLNEEVMELLDSNSNLTLKVIDLRDKLSEVEVKLNSTELTRPLSIDLKLSLNSLLTYYYHQLESNHIELDANQSALESNYSKLGSEQALLNSSNSELQSTLAIMESTRLELDSSQNQLNSTLAQLETSQMDLSASKHDIEIMKSEIKELIESHDHILLELQAEIGNFGAILG